MDKLLKFILAVAFSMIILPPPKFCAGGENQRKGC